MNPDKYYLHKALELAKIKRGFCSPNPSVGAVLVNSQGDIISEGYHNGPGTPHAEVAALHNSNSKESPVTLYVTLEPCCHWGRTPPCTDAIIQNGNINRVVYGSYDPNPEVKGKGDALLKAANISCELLSTPAISSFYESYHHWHHTKTPFITAKIALSLNGKTAGQTGEPIQITGNELARFTHASRKTHDAILTGINTILHDDPKLNVRLDNQTYAKPVYILDSRLRFPKTAALFKTARSITIFHSSNASKKTAKELTTLGARCIPISQEQNTLNLTQIIKKIGEDGIHDLWIEAGGTCFAGFYTQKLLQKAYIYLAPRWFENGQNAFPDGFFLDFSSHLLQWQQHGKDVLCEIRC